jgi:SAM-dependent methyltransferase
MKITYSNASAGLGEGARDELTDWDRIGAYGSFISKDPFRIGLHYPAVEGEIGDPKTHILDVGCGEGLFARLLAAKGATVVGYDKAPQKILEATAKGSGRLGGLKFVVATPGTFSSERQFDVATSVMALNYATSLDELGSFFRSTSRCLVAGGRFISVVLSPAFCAFGKDLGVRRITKLPGDNVKMEFLDPGSRKARITAVQHQFTKKEFEHAAAEAGMSPEPWKKLFATREALAQQGVGFWQACHETQPYALFVARKAMTGGPSRQQRTFPRCDPLGDA